MWGEISTIMLRVRVELRVSYASIFWLVGGLICCLSGLEIGVQNFTGMWRSHTPPKYALPGDLERSHPFTCELPLFGGVRSPRARSRIKAPITGPVFSNNRKMSMTYRAISMRRCLPQKINHASGVQVLVPLVSHFGALALLCDMSLKSGDPGALRRGVQRMVPL